MLGPIMLCTQGVVTVSAHAAFGGGAPTDAWSGNAVHARCWAGLQRRIWSISWLWLQNGSQEASRCSFGTLLDSGCKVAPRRPPEAHFKHFWALLAKWLPGGLQRLIWSISGLRLQSCSQEHCWAQAAKLLPGGLQRLILSISGLCLQSSSQQASRGASGAFLGSGCKMAPKGFWETPKSDFDRLPKPSQKLASGSSFGAFSAPPCGGVLCGTPAAQTSRHSILN